MKKEYLDAYKDKLNNLSEDDKKLRDQYLHDLASGKILGPQVGYPSIDKPQLKYYRDKPVKSVDINQSMYDAVFKEAHMIDDAIGYLGANITYRKLKSRVDKCAAAFKKNGVKAGDSVLIGISNCPEAIITLLALNKIGAVAKWFDLRASADGIKHYAQDSKCKMLVAFDLIIPSVNEIIDETEIEKVVVVNPVESLIESLTIKQKIELLKKQKESGNKQQIDKVELPDDKRYISFKDFNKYANFYNKLRTKQVKYEDGRPSISIQSSGTTGAPKSILHSDRSAVNLAYSISYSDLPFGRGTVALVALPPWIAYGIGDACIMPLILGGKIELCPTFDPDSVYKYIGKFTVSFAAPFHYRYLKDHINELSKEQLEQLYEVECMISGGDKITIQENKEWEDLFHTVVVNGWGDNEGFGALTVNPTKANRYGSVGIPKYGETIIAYDSENNVELPYGVEGELVVRTDTLFLGYENNPEETKRIKKTHSDGRLWLHPLDTGFIDSDGFVHYTGRLTRVIRRLGWKMSAANIENKLAECEIIKESIAVEVNDSEEEYVPMAFIVLNNNNIDLKIAKDQIYDFCKLHMKENEIPKHMLIVESLPYTKNGKYDFRFLQHFGNEYVANLENNKTNQRVRKKD